MKKYIVQFFFISLLTVSFFIASPVYAETESGAAAATATATEESANDRSKILSTFVNAPNAVLEESFNERREQHKILFYMGLSLLVFVLLTAGFGVSMAMLGKEVFVPHMICAGITVFLSVAHAVVAVVWFFPF